MSRRIPIPSPVLALCAEIVAVRETHSTLKTLFLKAGAPGEIPSGNKTEKALEWLTRINSDETVQPLEILGRIIQNYMEEPIRSTDIHYNRIIEERSKITDILSQFKLQYAVGGKIIGALGSPSHTLEEYLRDYNIAAIDSEFKRALLNVESDPREAVSAASNILESFCKVYIDDEKLEMPKAQELQPLWNVVRKHLGINPALVEDQDLQMILTGLISVVRGIGNLRTHASSAHGIGKRSYKLESRHSRLAIHAAHTIVTFALESWSKKAK